jgi:hypothetical protein
LWTKGSLEHELGEDREHPMIVGKVRV